MWDLRSNRELTRLKTPTSSSSSRAQLQGLEAFTHARFSPNSALVHFKAKEDKTKLYLMELADPRTPAGDHLFFFWFFCSFFWHTKLMYTHSHVRTRAPNSALV